MASMYQSLQVTGLALLVSLAGGSTGCSQESYRHESRDNGFSVQVPGGWRVSYPTPDHLIARPFFGGPPLFVVRVGAASNIPASNLREFFDEMVPRRKMMAQSDSAGLRQFETGPRYHYKLAGHDIVEFETFNFKNERSDGAHSMEALLKVGPRLYTLQYIGRHGCSTEELSAGLHQFTSTLTL